MPRRYRRRTYIRKPLKTIKYSNETCCFTNSPTGVAATGLYNFNPLVVIPPTDIQGVRKVKNITLRILAQAKGPGVFMFALVYVPDGTAPNQIGASTDATFGSLYEPNQNVIMSGVFSATLWKQEGASDSPLSPATFRSRLARNLNSGDAIALLIASPDGFPGYQQPAEGEVGDPPITFTALTNFAISY